MAVAQLAYGTAFDVLLNVPAVNHYKVVAGAFVFPKIN
jgi:hypothetical protein